PKVLEMLNLEYLLEEAKANGLPLKKRAVIREYLQTIILNGIYKHRFSKKIFFMGGSALRFFYNMPRFSEDLDFNISGLKFQEFKELVKGNVCLGLSKEGFSSRVSYKGRGNLWTAFLDFEDIMKNYGVRNKRGAGLMLKIETNSPKWKMETESQVLSLYGYNFSSILMAKGNLLSEKLCALLGRKRGRDIYDLLFMLKKGFPFNKEVLTTNGIIGSPPRIVLEYLENLREKELQSLANQVRPFLFKEEDVELVLKAPLYAKKFLESYKSMNHRK
ncbi:nucleotidyl transferase AbiEii/AbiGii toxin family protein, partial [bacterium]|nr:nucleotidyl transferase AbiEii/AbiGii toxin family protein [bacterium]